MVNELSPHDAANVLDRRNAKPQISRALFDASVSISHLEPLITVLSHSSTSLGYCVGEVDMPCLANCILHMIMISNFEC